ncbi:MAG: protein kinase [Myxococcales bacterium]|nr:protein kinase [Myxococcales bacterium]
MFPHLAPLEAGTTLRGRYDVIETLGVGGMGIVYRAQDTLRQRQVALKLLHPNPSPEETQRLLQELALQEDLRHPSVVRTYDADIDPQSGALFFTMELIRGPSIETLLLQTSQHPPFPLQTVHLFLQQVVSILEATHKQGVLHGDIKPSHLLFQEPPKDLQTTTLQDIPLRLIDFGLARPLTWSMMPTGGGGTPSVMAPEQWQPHATLTPATDVYAVGMLLYRLLTGAPHVAGQLPPPSVWLQANAHPSKEVEPFDAIVQTALSYFPAQRYQDIRSFWEACEEAFALVIPHTSPKPQAPTTQEPPLSSPQPLKETLDPTSPPPREDTIRFDPNTEEMDLSGQRISTNQLEQLTSLTQLRSLSLCRTNMRDAHLVYLGGLEQLQSLHLAENPIKGTGLQHLFGLHDLRALSLSQTPLKEQSLEHLQLFPQLRWLSLWRCPISIKGLSILLKFPSLRTLHLSETPLTDEAFPLLAQFTQLRELAIHRTQLSLENRMELQKLLPHCKIRHA